MDWGPGPLLRQNYLDTIEMQCHRSKFTALLITKSTEYREHNHLYLIFINQHNYAIDTDCKLTNLSFRHNKSIK